MDNKVAIRNCHELLRSAFWAEFILRFGSTPSEWGCTYHYCLSDVEAVDWLHQLLLGDVVVDLFYNERTNSYSPALGAY